MVVKRRISAFLLLVAICFLAACGSSSNSSQSAPSGVSIALKPAPTTTSVAVGNTSGIVFNPVVSNDPNNFGVDWAVTCSQTGVAGCGTLSIPVFHSASGTAVTYIPPTSLSTATLTVNVTVFATADHTKNVNTAVTVTSFTGVLSGTYVLQVQGADSTPSPYQSTGIFVLDGKGNITSGQQTLNTLTFTGHSATYTVQGSTGPNTYYVGQDGRGTMTLNLQPAGIGSAIQETYTFVVLSSINALVAEQPVNASTNNAGSGTLEFQDPSAATTMPTGAYAFVTNGTDSGNPNVPNGAANPTSLGGVFNIDNLTSTGSISGAGSLADQDYYNSTGTIHRLLSCDPPSSLNNNRPSVTGSVSQPTAPGIATITLTGTTCFGETLPGVIQFTGYIVDATHIRLIESDDINGLEGFLTSGIAVSQGNATGTFTAASLTGPYVYGVLGYDINAASPSSFTSAGVINADGISAITSISDTFYPGDFGAFTAANNNSLAGTYSVDTTQIGRAYLKPKLSASAPPRPSVKLLAYLTGNGTPPLLLWSEGEDINFPANGIGIAYPHSLNASSLAFGNPENYGLNISQNISGTPGYGSGTMRSTIVNATTGTGQLAGTLDDTISNSILSSPVPLLDTFSLMGVDSTYGILPGTFMNTGATGPFFDYYQVDGNQGFMIETDLLSTSGVSLGYFDQACDVTVTNAMDPGYCQPSTGASVLRRASGRGSSRSLSKRK
ncbi:MAG: hypothetical protein ACLPN2_00195 [Terriglobales bacterium]